MIRSIASINSRKQNYHKEELFSILNKEHIPNEDYAQAKNVWSTFRLKS